MCLSRYIITCVIEGALIGRTIRDDQFQTETDRIRLKYSADASNIVHAAMSRFKDIRGTVAQHLKDLDRLQSIAFFLYY